MGSSSVQCAAASFPPRESCQLHERPLTETAMRPSAACAVVAPAIEQASNP